MTTWFAQNSSVNIDSVNQWNDAANGSGSWLTWASLGASDVLVANGKTLIVINVNVTCATITNLATGGTDGGTFTLAAGVTISSNITSGTTTCITRSSSGADSYIVGNVTGGSVSFGAGVDNASTGIVRITGNVTGGSVSSNTVGVVNSSSGHCYITGNVTCPAGNVFQGFAIYNTSSGNIYITGNVTGTGSYPAVQNNSTGRVYVTGNVTGGSSGTNPVGVQNQSTGIVVVSGTITGGTNGPGYVGIVAGSLLCHTGDRVTGSGAINAVGGIGRVRIGASQQTTFSLMTYDASTLTETSSRSLYTGGVNLNQPAIANVRSGTVYGASNEYTGSLIVPSPSYVSIGVPTDNTVGSLSASLNASDVRSAIGLSTANLDMQLGAIKTSADAALRPTTAGRTLEVSTTGLGAAELDASSLRSALGMSAADLDSQLDAILAAASAGSGIGARTVTITVNDGTTALQNAVVRLTEGVNSFRALTNASGVATFNVDDATYTVAITKSGYSYAGTSLVVDGTETRTYSMTAIVVTPAVAPLCNVTIHVQDQYGNDLAGEPVEITFIEFTADAAETPPVLSVPPVQESDSNGLVEVTLYRDARYKIVYGTSPYTRRIDITVPDAGSYEVSQ